LRLLEGESSGKEGRSDRGGGSGGAGAVEFRETDGEEWRSLTNEHLLLEGTAIRNASTGVVRFVFGPGFSTNALLPNTEIRLKRAVGGGAANSEFQLQLERGSVVGGTGIMTGASQYEVMSSDGVLGVRGGPCEFLLNSSVADVSSGTVVFVKVFRGAATPATIPAGSEFDIASMRVYPMDPGTNRWVSEILKQR